MCTIGCDLENFINSGTIIPLVAIVMGCLVGMVALIGGTASTVARSRAREQTRRELAAYVAEGTIDPDKAVALLNAGVSRKDVRDIGCC